MHVCGEHLEYDLQDDYACGCGDVSYDYCGVVASPHHLTTQLAVERSGFEDY